LVWFDFRTGNDEVFYSSSSNQGSSWSNPVNLSNDSKNSWDGKIAVGAGNALHVVWYSFLDANQSYEVSYTRKTASSWETRQYLSTVGNDSKCPDISALGDNVIVAWEDYRDLNDEIYFRHSADNGASWQAETRLTYNNKDSFGASAAMGQTRAYVTWFDYRDAVDQIYFNRSRFTEIGNVSLRSRATPGRAAPPAARLEMIGGRPFLRLQAGIRAGQAVRLFSVAGRCVAVCSLPETLFPGDACRIPLPSLSQGAYVLFMNTTAPQLLCYPR
jgi:hypothetical protein